MNRHVLALALAATLLPGFALADEKTTVYRSKGASGENVYSQLELEGAQAKTVKTRKGATAGAEAEPEEKSDYQKACERGRENLALLESGKPLQHDRDGDGVMQDLTEEERATEMDQAKRQVMAYCESEAEQ